MIEEAVAPAFKAILMENEGIETTSAHFVASRVKLGAAGVQYAGWIAAQGQRKNRQ
jgi:hypothetical protein